jgi:hypothetical protein
MPVLLRERAASLYAAAGVGLGALLAGSRQYGVTTAAVPPVLAGDWGRGTSIALLVSATVGAVGSNLAAYLITRRRQWLRNRGAVRRTAPHLSCSATHGVGVSTTSSDPLSGGRPPSGASV